MANVVFMDVLVSMLPGAVDIKTQRHSVAYSKDDIIWNVTLCFKYHGYNGGL